MFGKRKGPSAEEFSSSIPSVQYEPYAKSSVNQLYNLLFCDDFTAFKPSPGQSPSYWQSILFSGSVSDKPIRSLADDANVESRIRALAYNVLRAHGKAVPARRLLGVIVEVPFENGLDVLAAYPDGAIRYINQSGKMIVVEGGLPETRPIVSQMMEAAQRIVSAIGPWDKARLPPPSHPNLRMTFLVSDGLYFGQGPMSVLAKDTMAAPLIRLAVRLIQILTTAPGGQSYL